MRAGRIVQIGTPEDIVMNPADAYVADFVAGISRLKVVHAHAVMQPLRAYERKSGPLCADAPSFKEDVSLSVLIHAAIESDSPIAVTDLSGARIGVITRADLLKIIIIVFLVTLTGLSAGPRAALWTGAFLVYTGLVGLWEKAMTSLALPGTAACISISIGIPLGMYCARRPRVYGVVRPIMDFMQTMPAFVYMIPVIAFFGTGKVPAAITVMVFGGTPVVCLTVLGLRGVPESIREAAIAYGASNWYLLSKVDLIAVVVGGRIPLARRLPGSCRNVA